MEGIQQDSSAPTSSAAINFGASDFKSRTPNLDDPVVISVSMRPLTVKKVLLDPGSSADVLFYSTFKKMQLSDNSLQPSGGELASFSGERVPISGRPSLYSFGAIVSTIHLCVKFPLQDNTISIVHADHKEARKCYNASLLKTAKEPIPGINSVYNSEHILRLTDMDPRDDHGRRLRRMIWKREVRFFSWLANVVMVRKSTGSWRMCEDFTYLNKACPKDSYPLPNIDRLVDDTLGYKVLSFMDGYSEYNQIQVHPNDEDKTTFITDQGNFCYKVMPFGLKNEGATYQRLMDKVFKYQIKKSIEIYVDDMVVKSSSEEQHEADLKEVFQQLRTHNMRLNPENARLE
ncbi:uncharacterized protein [Arachis hypogaea]|uniref:uncharacterized protein n=1 Tax=Arachis hypogaea TaxID=3818 RepID=UPI003B223B31